MKKLVYIVSDIDKALAFEWVVWGLKDDFDLSFILINNNDSKFEDFLVECAIPYQRVSGTAGYLTIILKVYQALKSIKPQIVHCHLRRAELAGITAARILQIERRIFTRHSSTYNHLFHPKGVQIDKRINSMATDIIAISENVKEVLTKLEHADPAKIQLVRHGFKLDIFKDVDQERIDAVRERYSIPGNTIKIGVIARYTWWKGYEYIISAFSQYINKYPDCHFIFANCKGNDQEEIRDFMKQLLPAGCFTEIEFEDDLPALYGLFDYYVHVPYDESVEAFGQTYIESLAASVPSIFTLSGIAREFVVHEENALVVPFKNSQQIFEALKLLRSNPDLCEKLKANGPIAIGDYSLERHLGELRSVYNG